jgi:hypothetical protein
MPSAKRSEVPNRASRISTGLLLQPSEGLILRLIRAKRAMMPPSPSLSARITKVRYFTTTTRDSAQMNRERMPRTFSTEGGIACSGPKHSRTA